MSSEVANNQTLLEILDRARTVGDLGPEANEAVITQALRFVDALPNPTRSVADLGSGAGVPGLIVALARPDIEVHLVERSQKRCDGLEVAVRKLNVGERVHVWCGDARDVAKSPRWNAVDVVVCRSFSPIEELFDVALPMLQKNGVLLVSEPPASDGSRWSTTTPSDLSGPTVRNGIASFIRS